MDWNGGMENRMDYGISSTAEDTTSHCVPASFVPFHSVRISSFVAVKAASYKQNVIHVTFDP